MADFVPPETVPAETEPDADNTTGTDADAAALRLIAGDESAPAPGSSIPTHAPADGELMTLDEWREFIKTGIAVPCDSLDPRHLIAPDMADEGDAALVDHVYQMIRIYKPEWLDRAQWANGEKALVTISFALLAVSYGARRYQRFRVLSADIEAAKKSHAAAAEAAARGTGAQERPAPPTPPGV
jgi:hypothetical protein